MEEERWVPPPQSSLPVSCFWSVMLMPWIPFYDFLRGQDQPMHCFLSVGSKSKIPRYSGHKEGASMLIQACPHIASLQQLWHRPQRLSALEPSSMVCGPTLPWDKSKCYKTGIKWDLSQTCHLGSLLTLSPVPLWRTNMGEEMNTTAAS